VAKKGSRSRHRKDHKADQRDFTRIAELNKLLRRGVFEDAFSEPNFRTDRRMWRPTASVMVGDLVHDTRRPLSLGLSALRQEPARIREAALGYDVYEPARRTVVCKRRKERRESLFRSGRAGSGIRGPRLRRMVEDSKIDCH